MGIVRRVEDDLHALEARVDDLEEPLAAAVEHDRLEERNVDVLGIVHLALRDARGDDLVARDDSVASASHRAPAHSNTKTPRDWAPFREPGTISEGARQVEDRSSFSRLPPDFAAQSAAT